MRYRNAISYAILLVIAYDIKDIANAIKKISHEMIQGVVKVFLELSNKNCDHGSHIPEVQLGEVSRLKLRV